MEIDKEKYNDIFSVYKKYYTIIAVSGNKDGAPQAAAILTSIYFSKDIDYRQLKDSIRDEIEESNS